MYEAAYTALARAILELEFSTSEPNTQENDVAKYQSERTVSLWFYLTTPLWNKLILKRKTAEGILLSLLRDVTQRPLPPKAVQSIKSIGYYISMESICTAKNLPLPLYLLLAYIQVGRDVTEITRSQALHLLQNEIHVISKLNDDDRLPHTDEEKNVQAVLSALGPNALNSIIITLLSIVLTNGTSILSSTGKKWLPTLEPLFPEHCIKFKSREKQLSQLKELYFSEDGDTVHTLNQIFTTLFDIDKDPVLYYGQYVPAMATVCKDIIYNDDIPEEWCRGTLSCSRLLSVSMLKKAAQDNTLSISRRQLAVELLVVHPKFNLTTNKKVSIAFLRSLPPHLRTHLFSALHGEYVTSDYFTNVLQTVVFYFIEDTPLSYVNAVLNLPFLGIPGKPERQDKTLVWYKLIEYLSSVFKGSSAHLQEFLALSTDISPTTSLKDTLDVVQAIR